jgi:hypothetical protein
VETLWKNVKQTLIKEKLLKTVKRLKNLPNLKHNKDEDSKLKSRTGNNMLFQREKASKQGKSKVTSK